MDSVYKADELSYSSDKCNLSSYFENLKAALSESLYRAAGTDEVAALDLENEDEVIAHLMGENVTFVRNLAQICSVSELQEPAVAGASVEPDVSRWNSIPKDGVERLSTLKVQNNYVHGSTMKKRHYLRLRRLQAIPKIMFATEENPPSVLARKPDEIVLCLRVLDPFEFDQRAALMGKKTYSKASRYSQNFLVLGSQTLCELADRIHCINSDASISKELGAPKQDLLTLKDTVKSSMFYFGDTLYCDFRESSNLDYAAVINGWAKANPSKRVGPFLEKSMETTTFNDLDVRLGFPYVYLHLGNCEHIVTIVDARLMNVEDPQDKTLYPLVQNAQKNIDRCMACKLYTATFIVEGNEKLPHDTMLFCSSCFHGFHTRKGEKIGQFSFRRLPSS